MEVKKKYNWKISHETTLPISKKELWKIISSPKNLELYHPFCEKNPILKWPGINSVDQVHYFNKVIYERKFINWIENIGYDLLIGEKNKIQSFVSWRIYDLENKSKLIISIYPYIFNMNYKFLNFLPFIFFVKPSLKKYLSSISKGLLFYIKEEKKVKKNQFGSHKWFSN